MKKAIFILIMIMFSFKLAYAAENQIYTITDVSFTDLAGNDIENPDGLCVINLSVHKNAQAEGKHNIIIAVYSTAGELIDFSMMSVNLDVGETAEYRDVISPQGDEILGTVKAFVWEDVSTMHPLSEIYSNEINKTEFIPSLFFNQESVKYQTENNVHLGEDVLGDPVQVDGWTNDNGIFTHIAGKSGELGFNTSVTENENYLLEFDTSYKSGEFVRVGFGSSYRILTYNGNNHITAILNSGGGWRE